jgi:uncharacterized protein YutE (UPF0331/DUF86 family)
LPDDVVLNKVATLERGVARVREEYAGNPDNLVGDIRRQDSIVLNVLRACETSIDLAMHVVRRRRLGIPQESREAFTMLRDAGLLDGGLVDRLMRMVGFRNVAVHQYQQLRIQALRDIVETRLDDLLNFARWALTTQSG